jgi:diguanylate cyclase (GGDEF)-like protein
VESETELTELSRTLASTETLQLAEIHSLDAFYTPIEERFERITRLGRVALSTPIVAITAVTLDTQWFKSVSSWNVSQIPLAESLCERTVREGRTVVVSDLSKSRNYMTHPLVAKAPNFRFYAGVPLRNAKGSVIGTLCALDTKAHELTNNQLQTLDDLASLAQRELLTIALHDAQTVLISKLSIARRQALLDPLTKTWNRRGGMLLLEESLKRAAANSKSIAVFAVDLNDFKIVNDSYGHAAGDRALRMVARELIASVRDNDGVCRCGGDEFFVVVVGADEKDLKLIAERVERRIKLNQIQLRSGKNARISVSIGIKYLEPGHQHSAEDLLADADAALYENKMRHQLRVDDTGLLAL